MTGAATSKFLRLHALDNVLIARETSSEGTVVDLDGADVTLTRAIPMAHKIAARAIAAGETVLKYGLPIGRASEDIAPGAHVHVHNLKSAYTASVTLQDAMGSVEGGTG